MALCRRYEPFTCYAQIPLLRFVMQLAAHVRNKSTTNRNDGGVRAFLRHNVPRSDFYVYIPRCLRTFLNHFRGTAQGRCVANLAC